MKHIILENRTPVGKEIMDGKIIGTIYQTEDGRYVGGEYEYPSLKNYYCLGDDGKAHKLTIIPGDEGVTYTCDDGYAPSGYCSSSAGYYRSFRYQDTSTGDIVKVKVVRAEPYVSSGIVKLECSNEFLIDDDDNDITATTVTCSEELTQNELDVYDGDGYYNTDQSDGKLYGKYEDTGERRTLKYYSNQYTAFVFRKVSNPQQIYFGLENTSNNGAKYYRMASYSASTTSDTTATTFNGYIYHYNVVKKTDYMKSAYPGASYNRATKECAYNPMKPSLKFTFQISGDGVREPAKFEFDNLFHDRYGEYTYAECGITQSTIETYREKIRDGHHPGEDFNITVNGLPPNLMRTDNSTYTVFHCGVNENGSSNDYGDYVLFDDENQRISVGEVGHYNL